MRGRGAAEPLIERQAEVQALGAAVDRASSGAGSVVLIEGAPGLGKSRLCSELRELTTGAGMRTLWARGGELEHDLPYGVARQLLERAIRDADDPERERLLAGPARLALAAIGDAVDELSFSSETGLDHGLYWLISNLASREPVSLVVDDAHWADVPTMRFLLYLTRRLEGLPVTIVLAARPHEPGAQSRLLDLIGAEPTTTVIPLVPLSLEGTAELLRAHHGKTVTEAMTVACHEVSGGNPYFLSEIAGSIEDSSLFDEGSAVAQIRSLVPPAVMRSILLRLGHEGEAVRATAEALAVAGEDVSVELLAAIAGLELQDVAQALEELAGLGIVARTGPISFAHPIIRSAVYGDISTAQRRLWHRAAAGALATRGEAPEAVAHHLLLTDPGGDPEAALTLRRAGERALARGSIETAVPLLRRAIAEPPAPGDRAPVLISLGEAELRAGSLAEAGEHFGEALEAGPEAPLRVRAATGLASARMVTDGPEAAFELLAEQAAALDGEDSLRLAVERAVLAMWVRGSVHSPWLDALLAEFARLPGETPVQRLALSQAALGRAYEPTSSAAAAVELARRALAEGQLVAEQTVDGIAPGMAVYVLVMGDDFEGAAAELELHEADAVNRGSRLGHAGTRLLLGQLALKRGELVDAATKFGAALEAAWSLASSPIAQRCVAFAEAWLVEARLALGDFAGAGAVVASADAAGRFDAPEFVWSRYGRGLLRLAEGEAAGAAEDFLGVGQVAALGGYEDRGAPWRLHAALALAASDDHAQSLALADEQLRIASAWSDAAHGEALRVRALVGPPEDAEPQLSRAVELLEGSRHRLEHARALVDWGFALRRSKQRARARAALESGLDLAARCAARPLIERARAELLVLGARPRRLMFSGVEALTATERRVAELAAEGMSNRAIAQTQFVTEKTIETHLRNVYRKLDVSSRGQLRAVLD